MDENDLLGSILDHLDGPENVQPNKLARKCGDNSADMKFHTKGGTLKKSCITDIGLDFIFKTNDDRSPKSNSFIGRGKLKTEESMIHTGETDSSDDEQNKYFEETKYNKFGMEVKKLLKEKQRSETRKELSTNWNNRINKNVFGLPEVQISQKENSDIILEPIFGIRIVNPLVSSQKIREKMAGKAAIPFTKVQAHVAHGNLKSDWVISGVIVQKSATKVSQKGSNYIVWTLSDLKLGLKTVSIFLFGRTYDKLWKTPVGTVVGVLNPNVMGHNEKSRDEATLSILNPDQVMELGRSKDLGWCKSRKKKWRYLWCFCKYKPVRVLYIPCSVRI